MSNETRDPQAGVKRALSAGTSGAAGGGTAGILMLAGVPADTAVLAAVPVGYVLGGFLGSLGKYARDRAAVDTEAGKVSLWGLLSWVG